MKSIGIWTLKKRDVGIVYEKCRKWDFEKNADVLT